MKAVTVFLISEEDDGVVVATDATDSMKFVVPLKDKLGPYTGEQLAAMLHQGTKSVEIERLKMG